VAWQTPKTNWEVTYDANGNYVGDYFNAEDYQRIKGNLLVLKDMAEELYGTIPMPAIPDISALSYYYETTINALERSIDAIANNTYAAGLFVTKTWHGNDPAPLADDLNRIENACLRMYKMLPLQAAARKKLAFTLGGVQF
jgi:hypothetical protein